MKMNRITNVLALNLCLFSCSNGNELSLPLKSSVKQENISIYPSSDKSYVGDPMPYFDNGKMNVFYLQDGRNTAQGYHPINLMITEDFVHYDEKGCVIPFSNSIYDPDYSLGTGSVIKKDDVYHFFYTGHNSSKSSGLEYYEKIQHATSNDLINWTKHEEDGFFGGDNDFRDPYVLYMEDEKCYFMLVTTRLNGNGVLKLYKSIDLINWNYDSVFYTNEEGTYNMECPTLIKFGDYWYLTFSEQGQERVTRYRYTKDLSSKWIIPSDDRIDDKGFYAGRLEKDDNGRLFAFGWCATKVGEVNQGDFDWGGNLVVHELKQKKNGELEISMPSEIENVLNNRVGYNLVSTNKQFENVSFNSNKFESKVVEPISKNKTRLSFEIKRNSSVARGGITFNLLENKNIGETLFEFDFNNKSLNFYNNVYSPSDYGDRQLSISINNSYSYKCDLIIDNEIVVLYINNTKALSTRIYDINDNNFAFYVDEGEISFEEIMFYE